VIESTGSAKRVGSESSESRIVTTRCPLESTEADCTPSALTSLRRSCQSLMIRSAARGPAASELSARVKIHLRPGTSAYQADASSGCAVPSQSRDTSVGKMFRKRSRSPSFVGTGACVRSTESAKPIVSVSWESPGPVDRMQRVEGVGSSDAGVVLWPQLVMATRAAACHPVDLMAPRPRMGYPPAWLSTPKAPPQLRSAWRNCQPGLYGGRHPAR
jgi:hypothetical protein